MSILTFAAEVPVRANPRLSECGLVCCSRILGLAELPKNSSGLTVVV
jgi:hypothetical protein